MLSADVSGTAFSCVDNNVACDIDPVIGRLALAGGTTVNGVTVEGSLHTSHGTPATPGPNRLDSSSLSIVNNAGALRSINVAIGDTDFTPPATEFVVSGSGTFVNAIGSTITMRWFDDPANAQGALTPFAAQPGILLSTATQVATLQTHAFSHNDSGPLIPPDLSPFSMTVQFTLDLVAGGELNGRTQVEEKAAIPEPASFMLLGTCLAALSGFVGLRRRS
jgi:hypothetical protein